MFDDDIRLISQFHTNAGHSLKSIKTYKTAFNKYRDFHEMSLSDLILEAKLEQENHVPENKLKLFDRINTFKNHLVKNNTGNTITTTLSKIKTFYKYNRIRVPFIPPVNRKNIKQNQFISYEDLLTKEEILRGLRIANDNLRNWILVMTCSGSSRKECKNMTNKTLYEGTYEYHKKDNFSDAIRYLAKHDNIICTCKLVRQKTNKPYYTFLNPETVQIIAQSKLKTGDININAPLLKFSEDYIGRQCRTINNYLELGTAGGYSRFRPHMFRKWHATHLNQGYSITSKELMEIESIDKLQGRNTTQEAYYKNNPEILKLKYVQSMNNISLYNRYEYEIVDDKVMIRTIY